MWIVDSLHEMNQSMPAMQPASNNNSTNLRSRGEKSNVEVGKDLAGMGRSEVERAREKVRRFDTSGCCLVNRDCKVAKSYLWQTLV